jgi:hypothetical protein
MMWPKPAISWVLTDPCFLGGRCGGGPGRGGDLRGVERAEGFGEALNIGWGKGSREGYDAEGDAFLGIAMR